METGGPMDADPAGEPDEALLLARARAGEPEAMQALFERHRGALEARIRRFLPRAVQRKVSVSDVVQEARILAFSRTGEFVPERAGAYRAWLLRIAELKAREALRAHAGTSKRAVGREVTRGDASAAPEGVAAGPSPSQAAMTAETRDAVRSVLATLAPDYREVLRLARLEGLAIREVAERMGRSPEAIKKLYGRALAAFGRAVAEARDGGS